MLSEINGLLLNQKDSVVTVTEEIPAGAKVQYAVFDTVEEVTANEAIKKYHKIAIRGVVKGEPVIRYGENIGRALADIRAGDWVHTHNLSDVPEEI